MQLYALLTRRTALPLRLLAAFALGSSMATVGVLMFVNRAAQDIARDGIDDVDWGLGLMFAAAICLYLACELRLLTRFAVLVERAVDDARGELIRRVRALDPPERLAFPDAELTEGVVQAGESISQNSQFIAIAFRSALLVVVLMGYIASVSVTTFAMLAVTIAILGAIYKRRGQRVMEAHLRVAADDARMYGQIADQLDGWKEVRMLRARRDALARVFDASVGTACEGRIEVQNRGFDLYIFGQLALYFLLGVVVFAVPAYTSITEGNLAQAASSVLFIIGPIGLVIQAVAILGSAEAAAARILALEARLVAATGGERPKANPRRFEGFEAITLEKAEYAYPAATDVAPFRLGPIDLEVKRGEILFISGGNGSGKSTLLRILTGLHPPAKGALRIDGREIGPANVRDYRALIASVLSGYHLFPRLYGLRGVDPERIAFLLRLFELEHKLRVEGDALSTLDLSTGQRKRLALVVALLEDRPVLVLDEWAADQDPQFRARFYRRILPALRTQGKTIVAVTHDDAYFDVADRRIHLGEGMQVAPAEHGWASGGAEG